MIPTKFDPKLPKLPTDLTCATTTEIDFSLSWADDARAAEEGLGTPATREPASAQEDGDGALALQQVSQREG